MNTAVNSDGILLSPFVIYHNHDYIFKEEREKYAVLYTIFIKNN